MTSAPKVGSIEWKDAILAKVDLQRTALLVIDLQKDFCAEDGALAKMGSDVTPSKAVVQKITSFLPQIREHIALVAFFCLVYDPKRMSDAQKERLIQDGNPVICRPEGKGTELVIDTGPQDFVFRKYRYSAFSNAEFVELLRARMITTVAVIGVDTHICVEGTVRHGYDIGYRMLVLSDLVATRQSEMHRHDASLAMCDKYFAATIDSKRLLELCRA